MLLYQGGASVADRPIGLGMRVGTEFFEVRWSRYGIVVDRSEKKLILSPDWIYVLVRAWLFGLFYADKYMHTTL